MLGGHVQILELKNITDSDARSLWIIYVYFCYGSLSTHKYGIYSIKPEDDYLVYHQSTLVRFVLGETIF